MNRFAKLFTIATCLILLSSYSFSYGASNTFIFNLAAYVPSESQINTGYGSGLGTTIMFTQNVVFSLEFKYGKFSVDEETDKFLTGDLTLTPIVANIQYYFNPDASLSPYIFGGASFVFASFKAAPRENVEETMITKQDPKNGLGFQGGLGVSFNVSERLAIYFEGYYLHRKTVVETSFFDSDPVEFDTNLSHLGVLVGIKYFY
jgi:opacity protein-like surface antigen